MVPRRNVVGLASFGLLLALGCVRGADTVNRPCPCAETAGFVCCDRLTRCVRPEELAVLGCAIDPIDASSPDRATAGDVIDVATAADSASGEADVAGGAMTSGVRAAYYPTMDFTGPPVVSTERGLQLDWGQGSPQDKIPADRFSALLSARLTPEVTDLYTLFVNANDGFRLWLDGELVLDWWKVSNLPLATTLALNADRQYDLVIEYYELIASANLDVTWQRPGALPVAIPSRALSPSPAALTACPSAPGAICIPSGTPACAGAGQGLRASYYRWPGFTELVHTQHNAPVQYESGWVPEADRYHQKFSARWEGELLAPASDQYTFFLISAGQAELSIAGQEATTMLEGVAHREVKASVPLTGGQRYPIRIDYVDGAQAGWAYVQLRWKSGKIPKGAIADCHFFPSAP